MAGDTPPHVEDALACATTHSIMRGKLTAWPPPCFRKETHANRRRRNISARRPRRQRMRKNVARAAGKVEGVDARRATATPPPPTKTKTRKLCKCNGLPRPHRDAPARVHATTPATCATLPRRPRECTLNKAAILNHANKPTRRKGAPPAPTPHASTTCWHPREEIGNEATAPTARAPGD
jgi:hypothetical protein